METRELQAILKRGEGLRIEFKEAQDGVPSSLYDTVVSFLNREGGIILMGVRDDSEVLGLTGQNLMRLKQDIVTALNNPDVVNPPYPLAVREVQLENHTLLYIRIPISSFVHRHGTIVYDRENDSDIRITDEARIAQLYARKQQAFTENQILPYLRIEDLDDQLFQRVRSRIALLNSTHPWLQASNDRILRDARFLRRDYTTGEEGLTIAAALVFGKDETIGNILPAYKIDVLVRRENLDRWDDRLSLRTNLVDSYLKVLDFLKSKWPEKFFIENGDRKDLRELIFRELTANVIVHREYYSSTPTEIIIYSDRVVTTNPNRARFSGPLDLETFNAEPKNPNIRAFFNVLAWADEIGSGVKNMNKYLKIYSEGSKPSFIEGEPFISILPMVVSLVGEKYKLYLNLAQIGADQLGNERIQKLHHIPFNLELKDIDDFDELALLLVNRWAVESEEFHKVRFLINNGIEPDELKKVGSWEEKSGQLLKKRARIILSSLLLSLIPVKLETMAGILGYRSKERYRDDYIKPLKDNGLIGYTIPEKANDPDQAYMITQKGKDFLGGSPI